MVAGIPSKSSTQEDWTLKGAPCRSCEGKSTQSLPRGSNSKRRGNGLYILSRYIPHDGDGMYMKLYTT